MRPFTHNTSRSADTDLLGSAPHSRAKEETHMHRTSFRTLVLLLELFIAVVSIQYLGTIRSAKASASWLPGTCATGASILTPDVNDTINT